MATFGELQIKVSSRLKDPNNVEISSSDVAAVLNDALQYWSKRRFWFNEFEESVTLTIGDPALTLVTNTPQYLFKEDGVVINYAQTRWPTRKISSHEYDAMNVEGRGIPFAYTERDGGYELYYYPDAAYVAVVRGVKSYVDMNANLDTNDFTIEAPDMLVYEALSRLYGEFRQDPNMESYYANRAANEELSLKRETTKRKSTGRIQVEVF